MPLNYSSGIYSQFAEAQYEDYTLLEKWLPGYPHLQRKVQAGKGALLLSGTVLALLSIVFLLSSSLCGSHCLASLAGIFGSTKLHLLESLFQAAWGFKLSMVALLVALWGYLFWENQRDLHSNFQNLELDHKTRLLPPAMGSAYLLFVISFVCLLFYGVLHFVPITIQKEIPLELDLSEFVDNPPAPPATPPKNTKRIAAENAVDSGKSVPNREIAPGKFIEKQPVVRQRPSRSAQSAAPKPQVSPNPAPKSRPSPYASPKSTPAPRPVSSTPPPPKVSENDDSPTSSLQTFRPKVSSSASTNSNSSAKGSSSSAPAEIAYKSSSSGGLPGVKGPVLSSAKPSGFSSPGGSGNTNPNDNPNGPGTVAARKGVDYGSYIEDLRRRISQHYHPTGKSSANVTITFSLYKSGQLVPGSVRVKYSEDPELAEVAKGAINKAAPGFRPLPEGAPNMVDVDFKFGLTVNNTRGGRSF